MESMPGIRMSRAQLLFPSAWRHSLSLPGKHDTACVPVSPGLSPSLRGGRHPWRGRGLWGSYSGFEGVLQCFTAALTGPASGVKDGALPMVAAGSDGAATAEGSFGLIRQVLPPNCFSAGRVLFCGCCKSGACLASWLRNCFPMHIFRVAPLGLARQSFVGTFAFTWCQWSYLPPRCSFSESPDSVLWPQLPKGEDHPSL